MHILYEFLYTLYVLIVIPIYVVKGKIKSGWSERFGVIPEKARVRLGQKKTFWVHAVSVGEAVLASQLIKHIRHRIPEMTIVLTTTTSSGREVARQFLAPEDELLYFPLDFRFSVRRFLDAVKPTAAVFMETEIWPNVIQGLHKRGIPIFIANSRISNTAMKKYRWVSRFMKMSLSKISRCFAQSENQRERFIRLGMARERVESVGNMKFDMEPKPRYEVQDLRRVFELFKNAREANILLAASTHSGEEEMILDIVLRLKGKVPKLKLILAPRHLERVSSIERLIKKKNLSSERFSSLMKSSGERFVEIIMVDEWGVLNDLYELADIVFVGGSMVKHGGHNIAEAAFAAKPIVYGPHMQNFIEMDEMFQDKQAAVKVEDTEELERVLMRLLEDDGCRAKLASRAKEVMMANHGVTQRIIEGILPVLEKDSSNLERQHQRR